MNKNLTKFLQIVTILVGLAVLAFLLWEPTVEGVNVGKTLFQIYFNDPFIALVYTVSIAFFVGLYQAFKLLGRVGRSEVFSQANVKALRIIKYCAGIILCFALAGEIYLMVVRPGDDIAGGVFMGLLVIAGSGTVSAMATRFERILQKIS